VIVAGQPGIVDGIDLFTTYLDTPDNRRIIVPNNAIFSAVIENQTRHPQRRVDVTVQVAGTADPQEVEAGLRGAAARVVGMTEGARREPAPGVSMTEIQPPTWTVQVWAETPRVGAVRQALLREVRRLLDDHHLHPTPAPMVVRITEMPGMPEQTPPQ
jgi:small conductance mechanosensitive channel